MQEKVIQIHPDDNVLVALRDLNIGTVVEYQEKSYTLSSEVPAKHKFAMYDLEKGAEVKMYGVLVGTAQTFIKKGEWLTTFNLKHAAHPFSLGKRKTDWKQPDISRFEGLTFDGFHRDNGEVGTANYWLVLPMVFCENRNLDILKDALVENLGYKKQVEYQAKAKELISLYNSGENLDAILNHSFTELSDEAQENRLFKNIDGIKFLNHSLGCGGTRQDAKALCGLLAGYICHPNVAGATVLSLGCQNAETSVLQNEIAKRGGAHKTVHILNQQEEGTENELLSKALKLIFKGLAEANEQIRKPAPLSNLVLGMECGASDGFSGISANPGIGQVSDLLVSLGGSVILSEFPELCGVEQELSDRCNSNELGQRFIDLMNIYNDRAKQVGSSFDMNPSPGNIKDGLITDAIKSAGAAKKGGSSPIMDVLDYPEKVSEKGLTLLCTPGNDVESTTAMVGSGANVVLFSTGLGTPTGNPIAPVIKLATNNKMAEKMHDIIDIDAGGIINGTETLELFGERLLRYVIEVASGRAKTKAVLNGQEDFIPWKRGVSL